MASKLTTDDLRKVRNAVYDAAAKWYDLGLELGISPNRLNTIKKDKPEDCLREMLNMWLSDGKLTSTWETLSNALDNQAVGFSYIAEKIRREKCGIPNEESNGSEQSLLSNQVQFASSSSTKMTSSVSSPDIKLKYGLKTKVAESKSDSDLKVKQTPENDFESLFAQKPTPSMDTSRRISTPLLYQDPLTTSPRHKPKKLISSVDHSGHRHGDDQEDPFTHRRCKTEHKQRRTSCPPNQRNRSNSESKPEVTVIAEQYNGSEYKFKSKPAPDLYCHECKEIACEPHQMQCNDCSTSTLFCKKCTPMLCPKCEKPIEMFPDGISNYRILNMAIICPNAIPILPRGLGCSWEGELQTVAEHRLECPRESVPCPYKVIGCEETMLRSKVEKHKKDSRDAHLDLTMKKMVSMVTSIDELTATVRKLEERLEEKENTVDDGIL